MAPDPERSHAGTVAGISFAAFAVPNFRKFAIGQAVSLIGTWTETVALALLVLHLTNSGFLLGLVTAARYVPVLLLTPYAGLIVDRSSKRRVLLVTQTGLAGLSVVMGTLAFAGRANLPAVFTIAVAFGCLSALDNPARQAFIPEIVGRDLIRNAVTINSTFVNVGRALGPLLAAVLVATAGIGWCFYINAASFGAVIIALTLLDRAQLAPTVPVPRTRGQFTAGVRYALTVPTIIGPVLMMAFIGTFTYEFEVSLLLLARTLDGASPLAYSWLIGAFGAGSVAGGLYCMRRPQTGVARLIRACVLYAAGLAAVAVAPVLWLAVGLMFVVGLASITFLTTGNSTIQLAARPEMRGRVTALWSTAFLGTTPIGASIIGAVGGVSPRLAVGLGAAACVAALGVGVTVSRSSTRATPGTTPPE
ncbi:MFS transporter [Frondihabitans australicus]|uniref:Putative MFS family arabinose efflux permease n=1 Tax=Frondihabitans australicus TaxID=386892 RepID=A0A495IKT1_9MICO|nr:MFS transporter [Frondihabitans australicus]RKR76340.1 putative MFS family arabinose efflux permease [Frondihabitans australicus]